MLTTITAITAQVASIPAQAAPPVPGAFTPTAVGPGDLSPLDPVPAEPVQPILFGDFDANGDGVNDFIMVKAPDSVSPLPRVGVVSGAGRSVLFVIYGDTADTAFGLIARTAGDVNNDGHDDLMVNRLRTASDGVSHITSLTVYSGVDGSEIFTPQNPNTGGDFGLSAAAVGDITGDGNDDILVGALQGGSDNEGAAYLVSGADGAIVRTHTGTYVGSEFGFSLVGLGDINNDQCPDYAISAPGSAPTDTGRVFIYDGTTGVMIRSHQGDPDAMFGATISALDDVDADGVADMLIAAPHAEPQFNAQGGLVQEGAVTVISAAIGAILRTLTGHAGYSFGMSVVASRSDVNSDGIADLLITSSVLNDPHNMNAMLFSQVSPVDGAVIAETTMLELTTTNNGVRADLNNDGVVNATDIARVVLAMSSGDRSADINADGVTNAADLTIVLSHFGDQPKSAPLFGPGHSTCAAAAAASLAYAALYIKLCLNMFLIDPFCSPIGGTYYFLGNLAAVGIVCGADSIY